MRLCYLFCAFTTACLLWPNLSISQVLDSGPSNPALFDSVINIPGDPDIGDDVMIFSPIVIGAPIDLAQINLGVGGSIGDDFFAGAGTEVNIGGGTVGRRFETSGSSFSVSEVNISGGSVGSFISTNNSLVNISGGTIGDGSAAGFNSVVNISGGAVGDNFAALGSSQVNLSGGSIGDDFSIAFSSAQVNVSGGTIGNGATVNLDSELNVSGGSIGNNLDLAGGSLSVSGGTVGDDLTISFASSVDVTGGSIGDNVELRGALNLSGGEIGDFFRAERDSEVNIFGTEFRNNGKLIDLDVGDQQFIFFRGFTLSGVLSDGTDFSFDIDPLSSSSTDFFDSSAVVNIFQVAPAVPEPSSAVILAACLSVALLRRSRGCPADC